MSGYSWVLVCSLVLDMIIRLSLQGGQVVEDYTLCAQGPLRAGLYPFEVISWKWDVSGFQILSD